MVPKKKEEKKKLSPKNAMLLAIEEAKKGLGFVEPNPPVACVILDKNHRFLSSGYHKRYGGDHAEVCALKRVKDKRKLKGAHVFVTLEPCGHQGKTPPCSLALTKYSIRSLVYGVKDPVAKGMGLKHLRKKKIGVSRYLGLQDELSALVEMFHFSFLNKRSFVSLKIASSLDGTIALRDGSSRWITEKKAREHAHTLRASHSAILIGCNTLMQDDPRLNIRLNQFKGKKNKIIILDPQGKSLSFLPKSRLLKFHSPEAVFVCCSHERRSHLSSTYAQLRFFKLDKRLEHFSFGLLNLLEEFYQKDHIQSILVEGGGITFSQFLKQKMFQKLYLYLAPAVLGAGIKWSEQFHIKDLQQALSVGAVRVKHIGPDLLLEAKGKRV